MACAVFHLFDGLNMASCRADRSFSNEGMRWVISVEAVGNFLLGGGGKLTGKGENFVDIGKADIQKTGNILLFYDFGSQGLIPMRCNNFVYIF